MHLSLPGFIHSIYISLRTTACSNSNGLLSLAVTMSSNAPQDYDHPLTLKEYQSICEYPFPLSEADVRSHPTTHLQQHPLRNCHDPTNASFCGTCKKISYCSAACQRLDWPIHKTVCKSFTKPRSAQPSPDHKRALFFPPESNTSPHFIYLHYTESGIPTIYPLTSPTPQQTTSKRSASTTAFYPTGSKSRTTAAPSPSATSPKTAVSVMLSAARSSRWRIAWKTD